MNPGFLHVYNSRDPETPLGGSRGFKSVEVLNKDPDSQSNFPGPKFNVAWLRGHLGSQYNFLKSVHENKPAVPSLKHGAYIQKIMNKLYQVSGKEEWISV
jgi:hypothetical protein